MRVQSIALLLTASLLAGCASQPAQSRVPTATAIPVPSLAPSQVFILTPNPAPTLTPNPTPTFESPVPTDTLPPPTSTPEDTPTPVPVVVQETPAPTSTMPLQSAPASACYNAFYPASPDARWQYRVTAESTPSTYDKSIVRADTDAFVEHRVFKNTATDNIWTCSVDGLLSDQFSTLQVHGQTQYNFTTTSRNGITFPPEDRWFVGSAWSSRYDIAGQLEQNGITFNGTGTVAVESRIGAEDQITIPAGTFDTLRVDSTITLRLTPSGLFAIPVTVTLFQYSWYARDTGMVRSMLTMNGQTATAELVSYTP